MARRTSKGRALNAKAFTARHFEAIAETLRMMRYDMHPSDLLYVANQFAYMCKHNNNKFSERLFIDAVFPDGIDLTLGVPPLVRAERVAADVSRLIIKGSI